jgi:hypothetical protein
MIWFMGKWSKNMVKYIQQYGFANGHPLNYWSTGNLVEYPRADGMGYSQVPVVVCGWIYDVWLIHRK